MEQKDVKKRKSNIELLRIIAMLCIISFHYVYKSGYVFEKLSYNSFVVKAFYMLGEFGVNIFILITGYFMCNSKFSIKKLICLILEVNFYYIFTVFLSVKLGQTSFSGSIKGLFLSSFPIIRNQYWFITAYILVYIISPYLNILIHNMNQTKYKKFLITILILWCVIPTIFGVFYNSTETMLYYSRFIWLIIMYFVGAYIRLYSLKIFDKPLKPIIAAIVSFLVMIAGIFIIYKFKEVFAKLGTKEVAYFWMPNTIPMFILSVSIFVLFLKLDIKPNNIINTLASTTLGIYMMHDGALNSYMWKKIFFTKMHLNGNHPIMFIIASAVAIFIVGAIIDLIRQFIEKHTVKRVLNSKRVEKLLNKFDTETEN